VGQTAHADLRVLKTVRQSESTVGAAFRALQLLQDSRLVEDYASDGSGDHGSRPGVRGVDCRMKWRGLAVIVFFIALYGAICFGAASHDETGKRISGRRRWLRFLLLFPWPFISPL
jgi:hypothetical protein